MSSFITDYGYLNLFVLSFLASTVLPLGSEALVVALIYQGFNPFAVVLVATSGNYLGSCTTYYLGLKGRPVLEKFLSPSPEKLEISERLFKKIWSLHPSFYLGARYRRRDYHGCRTYAALFPIFFYSGFSWKIRALFCYCLSNSFFSS
ncbi:YqaA family protein [Methanosarcina barkeri]|uniref:YqaA family protein n=1 Tax=Methanosarcina barkeri TaxID=2208 RepID=UPI001FB3C158|nr:hypothetical protein [Methanosarcina barkeri]